MKYNEKNLDTFEKIFNEGIRLAKENKEEAQSFFKHYIQFILESNDKVNALEKAERIAKVNFGFFGYFAGYFNQEVRDVIYNTYQCSIPTLVIDLLMFIQNAYIEKEQKQQNNGDF